MKNLHHHRRWDAELRSATLAECNSLGMGNSLSFATSMNDSAHKYIDSLTKVLGTIFLVVSGVYALLQYTYAQERDFQKAFYDKQIQVVMEVFDTLNDLGSATTEEAKKFAATRFWLIYKGKGRTFLDGEMFAALEKPAEYVDSCVMKNKPARSINCSNFSADMAAPEFAIVARRQLARAWSRSLSELAEEDPWWTDPNK